MSSSGVRNLLVLLMVCATVQYAACIRCFACTDSFDLSCKQKDCRIGETCIKVEQTLQNKQVEIRDCGRPGTCTLQSNCNYCDLDLCNSSFNIRPSSLAIGIVCLFSAILWLNN